MNPESINFSSFSDGRCLPTATLRQYMDGALPKSELHRVEKHLLDCDFCSHILEDLDVTENAQDQILRISSNVNSRISEIVGLAPAVSRWKGYGNYIKAGATLLILLSGLTVYLFINHGSNSPAISGIVSPPSNNVPAVGIPKAPKDSSQTTQAIEEFPVHTSVPNSGQTITESTPAINPSAVTAQKTENTSPSPTHENSPLPPAIVTTVPAGDAVNVEAPIEKEVISNLQIIGVKVLQKLSKTTGNTRKSSKKGQLVAPSDNSSAAYHPEDMPSFPGGDDALEEYLASAFKNPVKDKRTLTGKAVGVMFTVSPRGKISDVEITHSISPELDVEIIRLISSMPQWQPGKHLTGDITCVLALTVK